MTHKDIIKLAMEYGFTGGFDAQGNLVHDETFVEAVTEAVLQEREACANTVEKLQPIWSHLEVQKASFEDAAAAIRARSISRGEA
jgi:hypothetical protein